MLMPVIKGAWFQAWLRWGWTGPAEAMRFLSWYT